MRIFLEGGGFAAYPNLFFTTLLVRVKLYYTLNFEKLKDKTAKVKLTSTQKYLMLLRIPFNKHELRGDEDLL